MVKFLQECDPSTLSVADNVSTSWLTLSSLFLCLSELTSISSLPSFQDGYLPIHHAARYGHLEIIKLLQECDPSTVSVADDVSTSWLTSSSLFLCLYTLTCFIIPPLSRMNLSRSTKLLAMATWKWSSSYKSVIPLQSLWPILWVLLDWLCLHCFCVVGTNSISSFPSFRLDLSRYTWLFHMATWKWSSSYKSVIPL